MIDIDGIFYIVLVSKECVYSIEILDVYFSGLNKLFIEATASCLDAIFLFLLVLQHQDFNIHEPFMLFYALRV